MTDAATGLSILHVIVRAGPTNSQYNEHCLPVLDTRRITVCSLFPADVTPPEGLGLFEGDGTVRGCFQALRRALVAEDYDVVHVHAPASGVVTLLTYLRLRRARRDLMFTIHNSWQSFRLRNRLFLRLIMMLFPLVVVCGHAAFESIPQRLRRRRRDQLRVVPNGVDVDRIDRVLADHEPPPRDTFKVVAVSRLIPIKQIHSMLSAFASMRGSADRLTIVGDGPQRPVLEDRIRNDGLQQSVTLTGVIVRDDVYRELHSSDVFVTTSGGEGLPVALLEAMACGLPVVASDIAPHREVARVAHGLPLVPVGDTAGFARALERIRAASPAERHLTGQRLRGCVTDHFSVRAMNDGYGRLYRSRVPRGAEVGRALRSTALLDETASLFERVKHRVGLVLVLSLLGGIAGFGIALAQTPVFKGTTSLEVGRELGVAASDDVLQTSEALAIRYADLARREPVLAPLVEEGYADTWRTLQRDVYARVGDKNPQLLEISVYASSRDRAAELAGAVATSLVRAARSAADTGGTSFLAQQVQSLEDEIARTDAEAQLVRERLVGADTEEAATLRPQLENLQATLSDLRASYAELDILDTSEAGQLTVVDQAWTTRSPLRPTPLVLALAGLAIGFTLAIGWIHLFDRRPQDQLGSSGPHPTAVLEQQPAHPRNGYARAWGDDPDPSWRGHDLERR